MYNIGEKIMVKSNVVAYINSIKNNRIKLIKLKKAVKHYKLLVNQFGQNILDDAINQIKKEKDKENMNDLDVFLAYEEEIKKIVWEKHCNYVASPIKEIESNDIVGLAERYNTTNEVAQTIIDLKITDPHIAASLADLILKYNLKNNPNAIELSRIIFHNELFIQQNTVMMAEIILKFQLKDNPEAILIAAFIMNNKLMDNPDALKMYYFIVNNNLKDNPDSVMIANMVCKLGISLELAIEVIQYNHNNYKFKQFDEKYVFHKLKQLYQIKMKTEENFNMQQEIERIMLNVGIDYDKAKYLLVCCMGNNWGRNSSYYWSYDRFKEDFSTDNNEFTNEEMSAIKGYIRRPSNNKFARGFKTVDGKTVYNAGTFTLAITNEEIMDTYNEYYYPLYQVLNKYSLPKDVVVLRGTSITSLEKYGVSINDSEEDVKKKLAGYYQDGGFMSTSFVVEKKGNFLDNEVNYIIDLKAGTPCGDLSGISEFDVEREILIPPNVVFNVNDVKKIDGKIFVYLTSIPTKSLTHVSNIEENIDETKGGSIHL